MFTQQPGRIHSTGCPVHLFQKKTMRSIICCQIFRAARSNAMQFNSVECEILAKQAWMAGLSLSSTSRCKKVSWFQLRLQKGLKTFDRDLALFQTRFGVHSHNIHNPRNATVLEVAVAPCLSRPSPALPSPSKSPMPCSPRHGWISYHFLVPRTSKLKRFAKSTEKSMKSPGSLLGARHLLVVNSIFDHLFLWFPLDMWLKKSIPLNSHMAHPW